MNILLLIVSFQKCLNINVKSLECLEIIDKLYIVTLTSKTFTKKLMHWAFSPFETKEDKLIQINICQMEELFLSVKDIKIDH